MKRIIILLCLVVISAIFIFFTQHKKNTPEPVTAAKIQTANIIIPENKANITSNSVPQSDSTPASNSINQNVAAENNKKKEKKVQKIRIPVPISSEIPDSLKTVLCGDHFLERIEGVKKLGNNLSEEEISYLYAFLDIKGNAAGLSSDELDALKNDIAAKLIDQKQVPPDLAYNLTAMYNNRHHNTVWRDYCIQHLGTLYPRLRNQKEKTDLIKTLWQATEETDLSIGGTALISLKRNINAPGVSAKMITEKALALAQSPKCGEATKITAIQICANLGEKQIRETARKIAVSRESVPLRMSAIAAIGTIGVESDRPLLEKYAKSSDIRLRTAAQSALKRLK